MSVSDSTRQGGLSASQLTAVCVSAAVVLFLCALAGLFALSRPGELSQELHALDARLALIEATAQRTNSAYAYPKGAICAGSPDAASHSVQTALSALTGRAKLAAASSTTSVAPAEGQLQPLTVTVDGNGDYAAAIATLRGLSDIRPLLLLDRVDLVSKGTYLHLHLTGRAYCWSPAHL